MSHKTEKRGQGIGRLILSLFTRNAETAKNHRMTLRINHRGNVSAIHAAIALRRLGAVVNVRETTDGRVLVVEA